MKRSFFSRFAGASNANDFEDYSDVQPIHSVQPSAQRYQEQTARPLPIEDARDTTTEGQLPVDVHQTPTEIIVRAFVAGVRPDELTLSIMRDMVEISGSRMEREQITQGDYFSRELFWGSFARKILLPQEVDVDASTATAKDGLLTIILPKLDKARQTKLRVKAG